MRKLSTDYSRHLVLYSGGADSTYFIEKEPTARHLIHYAGLNEQQTKVAIVNANILNRYLVVQSIGPDMKPDGETNLIHSLYDTKMVLDAGITAMRFGMSGVVVCFNANDIAIDFESVRRILSRTEPAFEVLTPLIDQSAKEIRSALKASKSGLKHVSCMSGVDCGFCPKCKRGY